MALKSHRVCCLFWPRDCILKDFQAHEQHLFRWISLKPWHGQNDASGHDSIVMRPSATSRKVLHIFVVSMWFALAFAWSELESEAAIKAIRQKRHYQELLVELRKGGQPLATAKKLLQLPYAPAKALGGSRKWKWEIMPCQLLPALTCSPPNHQGENDCY